MPLTPLAPVETVDLIREVDESLIPLLRSLEPEDWRRPAVGTWTVRDVVAHLLDGALRRLSLDRDGHQPIAPGRDLLDHSNLVAYLNELNADWVRASDRLSSKVMTDLLEQVCPQMADYFESLDPEAEATFPVSWAGEDSSRAWMDVAREFTERWHHQQQIREAVETPSLDQEKFVLPLLETLIRALPRSYATLEAPDGTVVEIRLRDLGGRSWALERHAGGWQLGTPTDDVEADAVIELLAETAWRLFTKGITSLEAESASSISGERRLTEPFFNTLAIMA